VSELRKANTQHSYFITLTLVAWIDLFTRERYCEAVMDSFRFCMHQKSFRIYEYVIMPSHVHLICQSMNGDLPAIIRDMKSYLAKEFLRLMEEPGESRKEWLKYLFGYHGKEL